LITGTFRGRNTQAQSLFKDSRPTSKTLKISEDAKDARDMATICSEVHRLTPSSTLGGERPVSLIVRLPDFLLHYAIEYSVGFELVWIPASGHD
jgi:hypothetical protein